MDNKNIFAKNLKKYMDMRGKTRREVSGALGVSYYTFSDWINGKKYPRMDKVEALANYFGILKSDLIEEKKNDELKKSSEAAKEQELLKKYRSLDDYGKDMVSTILDKEYKRCVAKSSEAANITTEEVKRMIEEVQNQHHYTAIAHGTSPISGTVSEEEYQEIKAMLEDIVSKQDK